MPSLNQFRDADKAALLGNVCLTNSGLSSTAGAVTYATTATAVFTADGAFKSKAATAAQSLITNSYEGYTAAQMTVPATPTTAYFVVALTAAGAFKNFAGLQLTPAGALAWTGKLPAIPAGYTPLGYIKIVTASAAFVPGTTFLDSSTGHAITFVPCSVLPLVDAP